MKRLVIGLLVFLLAVASIKSNVSVPFGEISQADLQTTLYPQEKGAEAVVLFDYADARMVYNDGFKIEFTRHVRIKIFRTSGYDQANIQIPWSAQDRIMKISACTHNIENNVQVRSDLNKKQFFIEKENIHNNLTRFSFMNVREGSVIEYKYTILQDEIRNFHPFRFQRSIPVRYAQYTAVIPGYFNFTINLNQRALIKQDHAIVSGYFSTHQTDFDKYEWSCTHLPAFLSEPLMPEGDEYLAGVDFALKDVSFPGGYFEVSPSYSKLTQKLMEEDLIGGQLIRTDVFSKTVKGLLIDKETASGKLHKIFAHVRNHMQWNGYNQLFPDVSLSKAYREQSASNAEINLMLVNMLRYAGIQADPVILSTRDNGKVNRNVAIAGSLNYLVCLATIDGKEILLDASDKFVPEGMLPFKCLNGQGWVMNETSGRWIDLLKGENFTTLETYDLTMDEAGILNGTADIKLYGYNALQIRKLIHNGGETGFREQDIFETGNLEITNLKFENLDSLNLPLQITFNISIRHLLQSSGSYSFFNPFMTLFCDFVNPWVKDSRSFPIDQGCTAMDNFNCVIHFPETYKILEVPKPARILMPDDAAQFLTGVILKDNSMIITGKLNIKKTWFEAHEYPVFREFYTQVNKKCNEMIIMNRLTNN